MDKGKSNIVIYNNGELEIKIKVTKGSIWLTQKEIALLFHKERSVITRHINNIFKDKEVDEGSNVQILHISKSDKPLKFYSLDIILAVGYRTSSSKAIQFRRWATSVLKKYIYGGYVINSEKITVDRFLKLETDVSRLQQKVKSLEHCSPKPKQGIFYEGQVFDAYKFVNDLIKTARHSIKLIDNYIDESVLFSKVPKIRVIIYTKNVTKQLKLDYEKYKQQYNNVKIQEFDLSHDRFLIIDNREVYYIGSSLKDLGKKWFAFSRMELRSLDIIRMLPC